MQTNNHKIVDYDLVLDAKFGKEGTPERIQAEEAAYSFYSGQILQKARKEAKVTQEELARRTNTTKSYISKIENGVINIPFTQNRIRQSFLIGTLWRISFLFLDIRILKSGFCDHSY